MWVYRVPGVNCSPARQVKNEKAIMIVENVAHEERRQALYTMTVKFKRTISVSVN